MGKSMFVDRGFFVGLMVLGLLAMAVVGIVPSTGPGSSMAQAACRDAPSSMAAQPNVEPRDGDDGSRRRRPLIKAGVPFDPEAAMVPTISLTGVPTLPPLETFIPETRELPLSTRELPGLPTVPPVVSTPIPEPSATLTPTLTATPAESDVDGTGRRLTLLGALGLAVLCVGGLLVGGVMLFVLRRRARGSARGDGAPSAGPDGHAMLIVPGIDPIVLRPGAITIGRSEENDVIIEDQQVSRHHARVECARGVCAVEDLQSSNGTFVNGERVRRAVLAPGDRLRIGDVEMTYRAPQGRTPEAWLEISGERYPVPASGLTIGRSRENEIPLADPLASRRHARVEPRHDALVLVDLDSANGTFVNEQRVQQHVLRDGDEIRIGNTRIAFHGQAGK